MPPRRRKAKTPSTRNTTSAAITPAPTTAAPATRRAPASSVQTNQGTAAPTNQLGNLAANTSRSTRAKPATARRAATSKARAAPNATTTTPNTAASAASAANAAATEASASASASAPAHASPSISNVNPATGASAAAASRKRLAPAESDAEPVSKKRAVAANGSPTPNGIDTVEPVPDAKVSAAGKKRGAAPLSTVKPGKLSKTAPKQSPSAAAASSSARRTGPKKRALLAPEYDEVWKQVYLAGTEWDQMKLVYSVDWEFDHLDEALSEGDLANRIVHLFGATEPQLLMRDEEDEKGDVVPIPVIIAVVSDLAPPSKVGIKSVQRTDEEIVPMSDLRMEWQPYSAPNVVHRGSTKPYVSVLTCSQRRARLCNMQDEAVHRYDYVLPYFFNPEKQEDVSEDTVVQVMVELEGIQAPLMCEYDYELDEIEEFVNEKIEEEGLDESKHADVLKNAIEETVEVAKLKYRSERDARKKQADEISAEEREAIKNMKLIKFYPMNEWPDLSQAKSKYINRYYGQANELRDSMADE